MKPQIIEQAPRISSHSQIANSGRVDHPSEAWRRKMALLETIHTEISSRLEVIIADAEEDFIPIRFATS